MLTSCPFCGRSFDARAALTGEQIEQLQDHLVEVEQLVSRLSDNLNEDSDDYHETLKATIAMRGSWLTGQIIAGAFGFQSGPYKLADKSVDSEE